MSGAFTHEWSFYSCCCCDSPATLLPSSVSWRWDRSTGGGNGVVCSLQRTACHRVDDRRTDRLLVPPQKGDDSTFTVALTRRNTCNSGVIKTLV